MGIHSFRNTGDKFSVIPGQGSACDDAAQLFVRILGAIQGNSEAAHTVADQKYGNAGILGNRQIDYNVSVIQQFIKVRVIGALSLGTSVAAVIKAVGADSGLVEQPGKIVVPALVFTQSVDNDGDSPAIHVCLLI